MKIIENAEAEETTPSPKKYPITFIRYVESPTLGRLVDLGRKKCANQITAIDATDGKPVRFLRLDQTSRIVRAGPCGLTLNFPGDRVSVGEVAWEVANLNASWGTQNRLKYAPERPIYGVRDLWLHSLSIDGNMSLWEPRICSPKQMPTTDDYDIAVLMGFKDRKKAKP